MAKRDIACHSGNGFFIGPCQCKSCRVYKTVCSNCGESEELAKIKGCLRCLKCGFKEDCNGW